MITELAKLRPVTIRKPDNLHGEKEFKSLKAWYLTVMPQSGQNGLDTGKKIYKYLLPFILIS